jgi:hypothetical protein
MTTYPFNEKELNDFALKLGLKISYAQNTENYYKCHYDITKNVKLKAIQLGAIPVNIIKYFYISMTIFKNHRSAGEDGCCVLHPRERSPRFRHTGSSASEEHR